MGNVEFIPRTPKRNGSQRKGKAGFYDFYPGYSTGFVTDILQYWDLMRDSVILDPWNGSGTTTEVAAKLGYRAIGYDLNPVMFVVARAREISIAQCSFISEVAEKIVEQAKRYRKYPIFQTDPLDDWFVNETVKTLRAIERSVQSVFFRPGEYIRLLHHKKCLLSIPSEAAFFYLALFRVLKELSLSFRSSNPTWIKKPKSPDKRKRFSRDFIIGSFEHQVNELLGLLRDEQRSDYHGETVLGISSSESLPLKEETVHGVITSPPYCTRIDYAVLTRLELALLGSDDRNLTKLRECMIGSPLTRSNEQELKPEWGKLCLETVASIHNHESKASKTYYRRTYVQYFHALYQSLKEINRVLKRDGKCAFVVQNSYYKEVYIDLGTIVREMADSLRWEVTDQFDYYFKQNMIRINTRSNKYREKDDTKGKEIVLLFQKRG